ncbi:histone-lysine N-methyltransferase eggless [Venturia canescens]|uniref:histone-lysine N-methyltransferase eggless n=1 Tax=Venturia canescens TaxID=32260 RepID=UPI001C9D2EB5|nr:histone-lysine N-methyltransferase eggless [Venturia canescens]XP_043284869.1 histone-lysine N-methyltransferase eggless [Venturia canescens]
MANIPRIEILEIIDLDSDEGSSSTTKNNKPAKTCSNCINFKCSSGLDLKTAPSFACAYYGINLAKKRKRLICQKCFDKAMEHQEKLATALHNKTPILKCEFPDHTMEVEISDSEESDEEKKESLDARGDYLPEDFLLDIEQKIEPALQNVLSKYDLDYQLKAAHKILETEWTAINDKNAALDEDIMSLTKQMDSLRKSLYSTCVPEIKMLQELQISDPPKIPIITGNNPPIKRQTPGSSIAATDCDVTPLHAVNRSLGYDLPPQGTFTKQMPEVDYKVFVMKHPLMPWVRGKVQQVVTRSPLQCRVKLFGRRNNGAVRTVIGKHMAIGVPCTVVIPVATRVVAVFLDANSSDYYSGVIAEPPKSTNRYRYLVFFDDGYAQYVLHKYICIVCENSPRVWEDIPAESRDFVKKYLETYPERPMVKLLPGQVVKTEWNGKWWIARVIQVDGSLVQMHFDADDRTEWIYRGSARLGPLYLELLKANARQHGHHVSSNTPSRHRLPLPTSKTNAPYVEYTSFNPELESEQSNDASVAESSKSDTSFTGKSAAAIATSTTSNPTTPVPQQSRAVAKKRTAPKQNSTEIDVPVAGGTPAPGVAEKQPSHSIVYYQTQNKIQTRKFVIHKCGPPCVKDITFTPDDLKGYSPLSIPLLCGWNRQLCKFPKGKKVTLYQAPCGVRLRNMEELHTYLRKTGSPMSVDLFDFDYWVHCLAEFVLDKCFVNIKDLSYGVENVAIPCVNEIDHALPDTIRYSTQREPTEGVDINLDPEFLCSCDCTDDCQDKTKCQCWQLTIQGATLGGQVLNNEVGYVYKRLPEPVTTGIYECNSRCKCSVKTCLNRVVQHPLTLKLQVFKTAQRGWGIRCLNDIPLGSFVCIYAGRLLTEQGANEGGKNYGDEYLAELDYVEVVEGIKEGYENDVLDPEGLMREQSPQLGQSTVSHSDDEGSSKKPGGEFDEDFNIKLTKGLNEIELDSDRTPIRRRLRKRKKSEDNSGLDGSEDRSEDGSVSKGSESSIARTTGQDAQEILLSDDEDTNTTGRREPSRFEPNFEPAEVTRPTLKSVRKFFGEHEAPYIMDAKTTGNIGRYLNHSCDPNVFVQNVFVDTHDVRFPWVAFFALNYIRAGQELTWNYSYDVGSIPGKVMLCKCGASNCRGRLL